MASQENQHEVEKESHQQKRESSSLPKSENPAPRNNELEVATDPRYQGLRSSVHASAVQKDSSDCDADKCSIPSVNSADASFPPRLVKRQRSSERSELLRPVRRRCLSVSGKDVTSAADPAAPAASRGSSNAAEDIRLPPISTSLRCTICLTTQQLSSPCVTQCGHMFCFTCISEALMSSPQCPVCRANVLQIYPIAAPIPASRQSVALHTSNNLHQRHCPPTGNDNFDGPPAVRGHKNDDAGKTDEMNSSTTSDANLPASDGNRILDLISSSQSALDLNECRALMRVIKQREEAIVCRQSNMRMLLCREFLTKLRDEQRMILMALQGKLAGIEADISHIDEWMLRFCGYAEPASAVRHPNNDTVAEDAQQQQTPPVVTNTENDDNCCPNEASAFAVSILDAASNSSSAPSAGDIVKVEKIITASGVLEKQRTELTPHLESRLRKLKLNFDELRTLYFDHDTRTRGKRALVTFAENLARFAQFTSIKCTASFSFPDVGNASTIVSSIEFDRDYQFFAVAGVCKKIKVYEYGGVPASLISSSTMTAGGSSSLYYPVVDIACESKISSISWNEYLKHLLASADYDGAVQIYDAYAGRRVREYHEHAKRVWSVDFNRMDPKMLASGSDDMKVRLWSTETDSSVAILESRANVCCVQFSPHDRNLLAFGSADHAVVLYDLRSTRSPLYTCKNHKKAVAYVKFIGKPCAPTVGGYNEFISASTDSHIRLWQYGASPPPPPSSATQTASAPVLTSEPQCVRTFKGHLNEKNFVGLDCDGGDFIASGSENNTLYVYNKQIARPVLQYNFQQQPDEQQHLMRTAQLNTGRNAAGGAGGGADSSSDPFLSAVAWKRGSNVIVAANSLGFVQVLDMVG